ncbi:hypothetical protein [Streptomyces sp. x-80]|uniref:hypothetical protein n=1 Tax=Streptomyces sp. x-80 TaxID=2789282 RepID=UPI00397EEA3F
MLTASALIAAAIAGYALLCMVRPFAVCRRCSGTGLRNTAKKDMKLCRRCHGTRYRLRLGRRLHHHARRLHADGTTPTPATDKEAPPWQ